MRGRPKSRIGYILSPEKGENSSSSSSSLLNYIRVVARTPNTGPDAAAMEGLVVNSLSACWLHSQSPAELQKTIPTLGPCPRLSIQIFEVVSPSCIRAKYTCEGWPGSLPIPSSKQVGTL